MKQGEIHSQIIANRKRLEQAFKNGEITYYLDECMFTVKTFMNIDWSTKRQNVTIKSSEFNTQSTAFLGVIREGEGMMYWKTYDRAVKTDHFIKFLEQLRKRHGRGRFNLYMDNLRVHTSKRSQESMEELNIDPIWAPIYSPDYNPIELVFSQMKAMMKRYRLQDMVKERKRSFKELMPTVVRHLNDDKIDNCIDHVMDFYDSYT